MSRTRRTRTTATEFARACAASGAMHDAGLCERIRDLEREVERLKADQHHCHGHWHWSPTYWTSPYNGTTSTGTIYTTNTLSANNAVGFND